MLPLNTYSDASKRLLEHVDHYQPATFIVTQSIESMKTSSNERTFEAYLVGSINEHKDLKYDDGLLHKRRELGKLYPVGSSISVLFNQAALYSKEDIPAIIPYIDNAKAYYRQRVNRYLIIKYAPFSTTAILFFAVVIYRWRKNPNHIPKAKPTKWIE